LKYKYILKIQTLEKKRYIYLFTETIQSEVAFFNVAKMVIGHFFSKQALLMNRE